MKKRLGLLIGGLLGVTLLGAAVTIASAADTQPTSANSNAQPGKCWANSSGVCYHWAAPAASAANPFALNVENDVSGVWQQYYTQALADWTSSSSVASPVRLVSVNRFSAVGSCSAISGQVRVCDRNFGYNGWLGLASIWISSDGTHITAGTVKLNNSYFNTATYNTPAWRRLVSCQELAHTLGLDHEDTTFNNPNLGSCMDYTNDPDGGGTYGPSNEWPAAADLQTLLNMYSFGDSTTTVGASASNGRGNGAGNGLGNIEDAVPPGAGPRDGDVFVRDVGNGVKVITHVFWADRGRP